MYYFTGNSNPSHCVIIEKKKVDLPQKGFIAPNIPHVVLNHCTNRVEPAIIPGSILKLIVLRVKGSDSEAITMRANRVPLLVVCGLATCCHTP